MPSLTDQAFLCFWQPSSRLSKVVLLVLLLACLAVLLSAVTWPIKLSLLLVLAVQISLHLCRLQQQQLPCRRIGLRHGAQGWQLWSAQHGWRSIQLRADSIATPALVLLRYRCARQWFYRSAVIPADSLSQDSHRRLRVRLKFSRQRWRALK
ncbi:protein YgfX [Pseudomonas sp. C27(2019)]|uniref:protein YgfX n=1 Tax=Pseudomonas sp. C27(2019) TaxID=2604941 RepID=UPI00353189DB